jgi:hypothetical protein
MLLCPLCLCGMGHQPLVLAQWCSSDNESMQFDRDRVSWRGNEAVLDDFAEIEWPDSHCDEPVHDAALAASLASTRPRHPPQLDFSASTESRCRRSDSDTEQLASPLRRSASWVAGSDASWGEVHTPRNVATADSAFVMAPETLAALLSCQRKVRTPTLSRAEGALWDVTAGNVCGAWVIGLRIWPVRLVRWRLGLTVGRGWQSELGAWLRDGMAPWDTPADL